MGNSFSINLNDANNDLKESSNKTSSLVDYVDMIATNYILKQNMIDMIRFTDKEYYDNMVILTSYIMKNQLNNLDIGFLKNRVIDGLNGNNNNQGENENMYFAHTNKLKEITIKNEKMKQKALLIISKFYIKIMTLFSAIVATIDPQYVYEDEEGNKQYFNLRDFNSFKKLDKETKELRVSRLDNPIGLVKKRLAILKNKINQNSNKNNEDSDHVVLNPGEKFCEENPEGYKLKDEIGIKELDVLYFDEFDAESNTWNKRSKLMQRKYDEDVLTFYQIFTGKKNKPEYVNSFEDIETLPFHQLKRCINKDHYQDLLISKKDRLFQKYMEKIYMIQNITKSYKKKMLHILKQVIIPSEGNSETSFTISPSLHMESLLRYQDNVRDCINQIYINCERLFIEALILYEKMYERQHGVLVEKQINHLEKSNNVFMDKSVSNESAKEANVTLDANALGNTPMEELSSTSLNSSILSAMESPLDSSETMSPVSPAINNEIKIAPPIANRIIEPGVEVNKNKSGPNTPTPVPSVAAEGTQNKMGLETPAVNGPVAETPPLPLPSAAEEGTQNKMGLETPAVNGPVAETPPLPLPSAAAEGTQNKMGVESASADAPPIKNSGVLETPEESPFTEVEQKNSSNNDVSAPIPMNTPAFMSQPTSSPAPTPESSPAPTSESAPAPTPEPVNAPEPAPAPTPEPVNASESAPTPAPAPAPAPTPDPVNAPAPAPVNAPTNTSTNAPESAPAPVNAPTKASESEAAPTPAPAPAPATEEEKKLEEVSGGTQDILHTMRNGIRGFLNPS